MRCWPLGFFVLAFAVESPAQDGENPRFSTGQRDLVFKEAAPESSDTELKRRFRATKNPPVYDIAKERFRVELAGSYRQDAPGWGLFVWVDSSPEPMIPRDWGPILEQKKLIGVAAHDTGNSRALFDRCRLAVDAVHNMKRLFRVDPDRIYVSGMSGGGRVASMLGVAYADVFAGTFPMMGVNFYNRVPTGNPNEFWMPVYQPEPSILADAKTRNRYVLLTGEKDFNRENTHRIHKDGFEAEGFRHALYLEVPGLGHSRPTAEWLARGVTFLDDEAPARKKPEPTPVK